MMFFPTLLPHFVLSLCFLIFVTILLSKCKGNLCNNTLNNKK
jgi:hypothetical protein